MRIHEWAHDGYTISTDPDRFDAEVFHRYLADESYWANGRLRETTYASLAGSLVFGAYTHGGEMVGAARVVTDCATFGWLCDVFVLPEHRGAGLGRALIGAVRRHPCLDDTKRILVATADAHSLYAEHGFESLLEPERWMQYVGSTA